jgi:hypothetical protein
MISLRDKISKGNYILPHKFSFITLEEFCELNNIDENNITEQQINYFYDNYGKKQGLPASNYDLNTTHNDWIIENLMSHDYKIVVKRINKLLGSYILDVNTDRLSEKHTNARIIRISLNKACDIFNDDSEKTFKLNVSKLSNEFYNIINFHNYYITLIYKYDNENVIILEPKFTDNATDFVSDNKFIYHITDKNNLNNILKKGLRPKAKKNYEDTIYRYFIDRIYFTVHSNDVKYDLKNVIHDLGYSISSNDYVLIKIDTSKLNITFWWDDASYGTTVYTYESIPPKFIEVINIDNI